MPTVKDDGDKIRVELSEEDQKEFSKLQWCRAQSVFNGICQRLKTNGWQEGYRNNMAVNLMITSRMLGITEGDNNERLVDIVDAWAGLSHDAEIDLRNRIDIIEGYVERWIFDAPLAYMLDESYYTGFAKEEKPVEIVF